MRTLLAAVGLLVMFSAAIAADDKIDPAKLVGKWEPKQAQKDFKLVMEFTKDGKLTVTTDDFKVDGTYKLDGNRLQIVLKAGENEVKDTVTIHKLTDDELVGESQTKKEKETFKRVK
jgi:uncharacterized protein (TIGR03066 family)